MMEAIHEVFSIKLVPPQWVTKKKYLIKKCKAFYLVQCIATKNSMSGMHNGAGTAIGAD